MMSKVLRAAGIAVVLPFAVASCATILEGTSQDIMVDTDPQGASCTFARGAEGTVGTVAATPGKLNVRRRQEAIQITCTRDGFEPATEVLASSFSGATIGNVIAGGLFGVIVDASSGANNRYPERLTVVMTPASFTNAAARDEHFTKAADRIKESAAKEIAAIRERCSSTQREFCQIDIKRIEDSRDRALESIERRRSAAKVVAESPTR